MMNNAFVAEQSDAMAARVESEVGADPAAQFQRAWLLAFSRKPSEADTQAGVTFLAEQAALASASAAEVPADPKKPQVLPAHVALRNCARR